MQRDISNYAPAVAEFIGLLDEVFNRNGPHAVAEDVIPLIRASGHFVDDRYVLFPVCLSVRGAHVHPAKMLLPAYSSFTANGNSERMMPP
jgi:hypothetical protein